MATNLELDLAWNFVNNTDRNVFLTGKAGTGKTTFLHKLKMESLKRMVVVAPTGVAAINAKGVTIHSFFQVPFGPILPHTDLNANKGFNKRFNKTKIDIIKSMDLLVIDEISMVRADLLDGIDKTLRRFRSRDQVFGGVQLLMIGDLQQLSPVIRDDEWQLLKPFYKNGFFFSSHAYALSNTVTVELRHIYRQDSPVFINILNEIRNNALTQASANELNKRYLPDFVPHEADGYIALTTHNNRAEQTNITELNKLKTKARTYKASIEGKFPEYAYPNNENLILKVGAQVMFIKNDSSVEKRYFNGKIGKVILLDQDEVVVKCPDDEFNIVTTPEVWENINYTVEKETKAITENKIGSYTQMPLRLAWSITIHKSQGLTFEKAIIDAQGAFAHGQTYVALSRCKSLEGLVLKSKIGSNQIISDTNVISFNKLAEENQPNEAVLLESKTEFQLNLINEVFNFYKFLHPIGRILDVYYKNRTIIQGTIEPTLNTIKEGVTSLLKISNGFKAQLKTLSSGENPEDNAQIQERFVKAIAYFDLQTNTNITTPFKTFCFTTDNKTIEKDINKQLDTLEALIATKLLYFKYLKDGFKVEAFLKLRAKSVFLANDKPKKPRNTVVDGTTNVELFELLRVLRNDIAQKNDVVNYQVFTQKALYEICETLPTNKQELLNVKDMGKTRVEKYGHAILEVIKNFCDDNNIEITADTDVFEETKKTKKKKGDTKKISLKLFQSGKTIEAIANDRELNVNTIIGHLATFIETGEVKITDLISEIHYNELQAIIPKKKFENLSDLKHQLDDKYTYGELRLVLNHLQ